MKKSLVLSFPAFALCLFLPVAAGAGEAVSGDIVPLDLSGSVKVGYSSLYEYRGMALNDKSSGGMVLEGELAYAPKVPVAPMTTFTYRDMEVYNTNGQVNFVIGGQSEVSGSSENVRNVFKGGYQLISGGLPGVMKGWERERDLYVSSGTVHEFVANYTTTYAAEHGTWFGSYTAGYAFSGLEGWYMSVGAGYLHPITEKVSVALSGNVSWSFSYWTDSSGCDQLNILLSFPVAVKDDCVLTPYIMADWGAHNAKAINRETGERVVENFAVIAGVSVRFSF